MFTPDSLANRGSRITADEVEQIQRWLGEQHVTEDKLKQFLEVVDDYRKDPSSVVAKQDAAGVKVLPPTTRGEPVVLA